MTTTIPTAPDPVVNPATGPGTDPASIAGALPCPGADEDVRGEAARLEARLAVARDRLDALLPPLPPASGAAPRAGVAGLGDGDNDDDDDNPHLRELLRPAAARITRLLEMAGSLADGTVTDAEAAEAARAIADAQPHRRSR